MEIRKIKDLVLLKNNPRKIDKDNLEKLKTSITNNPDYFKARPVILSNRTGKLIVIAGNMRIKACQELGITECPTYLLENLTEDREKEIIIRDNISNGEWDYDLLDSYNINDLNEWGLDIEQETDKLFKEELDIINKEINKNYNVLIIFNDKEEKQKEIYDDLTKQGYKCQLSIL